MWIAVLAAGLASACLLGAGGAHAQAPGGVLPTSFERLAANGEQVALVRVLNIDPYKAEVEVVTPVRGMRAGERLTMQMEGLGVVCSPEFDADLVGSEWMLARRQKALTLKGGAGDGFEAQMLRVEQGRVMLTPPEEPERRFASVAELVERYGRAASLAKPRP